MNEMSDTALLPLSVADAAFSAESYFDAKDAAPHLRIVKHVRENIRSGKIAPGERLQLRKNLIGDFQLSSATVQRAFTRLQSDGFVVSRGRLGTFVAERPPNLYRIGMLFLPPKDHVLTNKYYISLMSAAAQYNRRGAAMITPYYGLNDALTGDRQKLLADLRDGCLAGLFWSEIYRRSPEDLVAAAGDLPQIFHGSYYPDRVAPASVPLVKMVGIYPCMTREIIRLGGRRPAVLALSQNRRLADILAQELEVAGLECRPEWRHGISSDDPEWAAETVFLWFNLPPELRPDSLIIADDHLSAPALMELSKLGLLGKLPVVALANFPLLAPPVAPAVQLVGFDGREIIGAGVDLLEQLKRGAATPSEPASLVREVPAHTSEEIRDLAPFAGVIKN